ncbi:hypothetical protein LR48_Vigan2413s000100 [Vigna angularis]|nr:hypothetical protein LR48_Vigan2413s000100 [Vigna angularis]
MEICNAATTLAEAKITASNNDEEEVHNTLYKQMVGSLRYLCNSRPDIYFAIGVLSRFMHQLKKMHLIATKRVLRYVKGTLEFGVLFPKGSELQDELVG